MDERPDLRSPTATEFLSRLYRARFETSRREARRRVWGILCRRVFRRWIQPTDTVLELGAGLCEFINAVSAQRRLAIDLNPEFQANAASGVETGVADAEDLSRLVADRSVDVVFASNFLEHLPSKLVLVRVLREVRRVLRPGGRFVTIGPNIRVIPGAYWDYFDHLLPLSDRSLCEALRAEGFRIVHVTGRHLPYTFRGPVPAHPLLVHLYLSLGRFASWFLGKQFLIVGALDA